MFNTVIERRITNRLTLYCLPKLIYSNIYVYINLYSPTSGSKEKKTYIHINTYK